MKSLLKRIVFSHSYNSDALISFLKKKGVKIGQGCVIFSPNHVSIDVERPHMLSIGDYCKITSGVKILTHDYSKSVLLQAGYEDVGEAGVTSIGSNVFLGVNSIVLMGSKIGNNCIVGAGSVCTGEYPDNSVIAGNPARVICSLEDYYKKHKAKEIESAKQYVREFRKANGRDPEISEMTNAFIWLYLPRNEETIKKYKHLFKHSGIDQDAYEQHFLVSMPTYDSFESFLKDCH